MHPPFSRQCPSFASTEIYGLPHLDIDISPGTLTLIDPDPYSLDHVALLRVIASTNKSRLVMVADAPVDLFESSCTDMAIAWRYKSLSQKPVLNLNKCVSFKNDTFETVSAKTNSLVTIFSPVDAYNLRKICRRNNNTAFVAAQNMPYLHFDTVLKIRSLIFANLDYHGLIEVKKTRSIRTLRVERMKSLVYGYKIKKHGVLIEDVIVPPELEPRR